MKHPYSPWLISLPLLLSAPLLLADDNSAQELANTPHLKTVHVLGQRPQKDVQQQPNSATTLDGKELERQGIQRLEDLQQLASGLDVNIVDPYDTRITIRGIGDGGGTEINIGMPSSVGLFLDNVYLSRPGMLSNDLLDIESATVLAGPQGTLFGYSTTGGAIDIHSRKPTFTPEGSLKQSFGQRGFTQSQAMFSGPLNDTLAGRINVSHTERGGYVKNDYTGHDLGGSIQDGVRGQLLWVPSDDFSLRVIADYNDANNDPVAVLESTHLTNGVDLFTTRAIRAGAHPVYSDHVNIDSENHTKTQQGGLSAEANWGLADGYNLRSVSSFRYFGYKPSTTDTLDIPLFADSGADVHDRVWSQELRLDSPKGEHFDYAIGALYFGENLNTWAHDYYANNNQAPIWYGNRALNGKLVQRFGAIDEKLFSLFSQGTWHVTERFDITAGVRGSYQEKSGSFRRVNRNDFDSGDLKQYNKLPSGLLNFSYWFTPQLQGYASIAYGEKAGGLNISSGAAGRAGYDSLFIDPEKTRSAELGIKSSWLDRRVVFDAALFWTKVNDFQTTAYDEEFQTSYLINAGTIRSRGVALDLQVQPLEGWTVGLNGTFLDAKYMEFSNGRCPAEVTLKPGAPATCDLSGEPVFRSPRLTYNLTSRYEWPLDDGLNAFVSGRWSYRTWAYGTVENSEYTRIPGYGLLALSTGLSGKYGDGTWNASLWLNNALDKTYYRTLSAGSYGEVYGNLGEPRTLGVTLGYDF
ncbi:TonB-dependent receptor [Pseudomonas sp. GV071]|jgi:iron complex outermembrane receptor protein|uniref:TonB-dependent receptor n=1 Tax=Pseudomonas sp. GV071 TaxID=2135754 RepID=UPI000D3C4D0C|nr:TonB-dependent receptor [Pseudomonas sp. GV071]PTQ69091.1 iron complex outermembrane receptor protein [Pseudomonas sp. GV071]